MNEEYTTPSPSPPVESFWQKYRKSFWTGLVVLALLTASLLTYILFFRSPPEGPTYQGDLRLEILAPEESPSGSEIAYQIAVENRSNTRLTSLDLEIFYPRGFEFLDSTPSLADQSNPRRHRFSDLVPGAETNLTIIGRLEGSVQEVKTLSVKLRYVPENFRSAFLAEASASTVVLAPELALRVLAPPHLVSGQIITYEFQITNLSTRAFSDIGLRVSYPDGFEFRQASSPPLSSESGNEWRIPELLGGGTLSIAVSGRIIDEPGRESFAKAELTLKNAEGEEVSAGRSYAFTEIRSSPLLFFHRLENAASALLVSGSELRYEAEYENVGAVPLRNVALAVRFENPAIFDFSKLNAPSGQLKEGVLYWVPAALPELLNVNPGQKGKFQFSVAVAGDLDQKLIKNPQIGTRTEFSSKELMEPIVGNVLGFKVNTQTKVAASAAIVGGQNPPQVGAETIYRIELIVTNSVNDLAEAEVVATIPRIDSVFVAESVSPAEEQPNVEFTPVAGIVRWRLGKLFALTGAFHEPRRLSFELRAIPQAQDSSGALLLKDIQIAGVDEFTGLKIFSNKIDTLTR